MSLPESMFAWRYTATRPSVHENLVFEPKVPLPPYSESAATPSKHNTLVRVLRASLNPVDFKLPEIPLVGRLLGMPATPCTDYVGRVVATTRLGAAYAPGDLVVGKRLGPSRHGTLAQYVVLGPRDTCVKVDEAALPGDRDDALDVLAGLGVAGLTSLQSLQRVRKPADDGRQVRVLIHGASGGVGVWGVQIAKAMGYHVTATSSAANAGVCKALGADQVIDYRATDDMAATLATLARYRSETDGLVPAGLVGDAAPSGGDFDLFIDNVGKDVGLYFSSPAYLVRNGTYVLVGMGTGPGSMWAMTRMMVFNVVGRAASWVGMGGGTFRKLDFLLANSLESDIAKLTGYVLEGKVRAVVRRFRLAEAKAAFEALRGLDGKKGAGKVVVVVSED